MLSKIKSATVTETRSQSLGGHQANNVSDNEDEVDNDTNNNNNNNLNNNQQTKKTQDQLLDIVEVARKRRLSRDSADSLGNFIKWSFGHVDSQSIQRFADIYKSVEHKREKLQLDEDILEDEDDWATFSQLYKQNAGGKLAEVDGGGSSAANLALLKNDRHVASPAALLMEAGKLNKRPRIHVYSPESKFTPSQLMGASAGTRKSSSYLGNVVDRLHHQQQMQQQQQQQQQQQSNNQQELAQQEALHADNSSNAGLSYHLQQFLQQQTSLEDLCSSVGLDDSNQLVLAAAIHRALVDSMGPNQQAETKSTASSTGSSSGGSGSSNNNSASSQQNSNTSSANLSSVQALNNSSSADLHLIDSLNRQRRAYNTRAALHGSTMSNSANGQLANNNRQIQSRGQTINSHNSSSNNNLSNRVQQQRHAQAAAALSALASAGSHSSPHNQLTSGETPIVDFECDTCGSSFDDRHRLMQHQSIHLELKKDWFTETPVDEVMKIFNRRRGEFLCNTCNLRFEATFDYDKHNHSVHGQRPYCCQFCGNGTRTFRFWRQYLNHLYDHRYIFSCTIDDCDFTVNRRDSLRFHIFRFHLNCQLPQSQHQSLRSGHNMLMDSKWSQMDDDDDNIDDMNVGE